MKRILSALVLSALLFTMLAAGGNQPDETTPVATTPAATTPADTTPAETTPAQTEPPATTPVVTEPLATTPAVTEPPATTPVVTTPVTTPHLRDGQYRTPEESPLTSEERTLVELTYSKTYSKTVRWYDESVIESRHYGARYYGRWNGCPVIAFPKVGEPVGDSAPFTIYYLENGVFRTVAIRPEMSADVVTKIEGYHAAFEEALHEREDLDDPYWFGSAMLPPLGDSPHTNEELRNENSQNYLGTYNGCSVYFGVNEWTEEASVRFIYGIPFWIGRYYGFDAYKDGEFYTLAEAYDLGYLTYEDFRTVARYAYGESFPDEPVLIVPGEEPRPIEPVVEEPPVMPDITPLTDAQLESLEIWWQRDTDEPISWFNEEEILTRHSGVRYYGTYNGFIALFVPKISFGTRYHFSPELVLEHDEGFELVFYHYGTRYDGEALYHSKTITEEDVKTIIACHEATEYAIRSRPDLDNPKWYGGQDLPPLGESPYSLETLKEWHVWVGKYLGTYNGYSVYMTNSPIRDHFHWVIGGVAFCQIDCGVYAVKDGEKIYLDKAYSQGILTYEDLRAIAYYWYGDSFPCDDD